LNSSTDDGWYCPQVNARFMVDVLTYNKMHLSSRLGFNPDISGISKYDKWPVNMRRESQLSEEMYMLLPTMISGFNLEEKKWGGFSLILKPLPITC